MENDIKIEETLSSNDIWFGEDFNQEENNDVISILSDMTFTAPYEQYVINLLNKIIHDNYKKIEPLFVFSDYKAEDIIKEFKNSKINFNKKEKKNKSIDNNQGPKENSNLPNLDSKKKKTKTKKGNKTLSISDITYSSFESLKYEISFEKIFQEDEEKEEEASILNLIEENETKKTKTKNIEIKDFLDTFNFNGKEYEIHSQILLAQTLKCLEEKENSFKFLCNIEYKIENIYQDIPKMEFDFIISNLDVQLFNKFINYLGKNILLLNFRGTVYEINSGKDISNISFEIEKNKKYDILGEIGLNAIDDENKIDQFIKYSKLLNNLNDPNQQNKSKTDLFFEKTGFVRENEKILFFVTNSKFNDIYKYLKNSKLYVNMQKINTNYVLCYLSVGLNERVILSNFLSDEKNKNNTDLLNKIKISNSGFIKSEKFKKLCYKLNELLSRIDQIKTTFYEKEKENLNFIKKSFSNLILQKDIILSEDLQKCLALKIKDMNQSKKEIDICAIYLKTGALIIDDTEDKLKQLLPNLTTICLNTDEEITKNIIEYLKEKHSFEKIYFFICNYMLMDDNQIELFVNKIITYLKISKVNYIFLYNSQIKEVTNCKYNNTLVNNIFIADDDNKLIELLKNSVSKINSFSKDLNIIFAEKKCYYILIKMYLDKNRKKILSPLKSNEEDFSLKITEILNFMTKLDISKNIPDKYYNNSITNLIRLINDIINKHIDKEYKRRIENVFNELNYFFKDKNNFLNSSKDKTINFCINYLKKCTLNYIYDFFIINTIPKIIINIYNSKIEDYYKNKENTI